MTRAALFATLALVALIVVPARAQDTDGDPSPDAMEAQIATEPVFVEPLELL